MMLQATNITKKFGDLAVLKGVDLSINKGEVVSIVGSSGAGKTTLLQILGTLDVADAGELKINNTVLTQLNDKELSAFRNKEIGFIFQFHQLLPEFTALENAIMPALIGGFDFEQSKKKARELFNVLGIDHRWNHKPSELSGGEQQRVAVARALINSPSIVFADEPSGNLDSKNAEELHQLFFQLREKMNQSFVIVTHNSSLADMADRKLVMQDGKIIR